MRSYALLAVALLVVSLTGCEASVYLIGIAQLQNERAPIKVTESPADVAQCEFIKSLEMKSWWGGALQDVALESAIAHMTDEAVKVGADTLLLTEKSKGWLQVSSCKGDAYKCGADTAIR